MPEVDLVIGAPEPPQVTVEGDESSSTSVPGSGTGELVDGVDVALVGEATVRGLLAALGTGAHMVAGDADVPDHWKFTDDELDAIAPPLTRIVNRRPALARAVEKGDALTLAVFMSGYLGRNVADARRAAKERDGQSGEVVASGGLGLADAGTGDGRGGWGAGDAVGVPGPPAR